MITMKHYERNTTTAESFNNKDLFEPDPFNNSERICKKKL
jgi:hypothetical protein